MRYICHCMNFSSSRSTALAAFAIASVAVVELLLSSYWAVGAATGIGTICGYWAGFDVKRELRFVSFMFVGALVCNGLVFLFAPRAFDTTSLHALAALTSTAFFLGGGWRRIAHRNQLGILEVFWLGWLVGFAHANFNALGTEDAAVMGYLAIYGTCGLLLGSRGYPWWKLMLLYSPIIIVAVISWFTSHGDFMWYLHIALPCLGLVALALGNLASRHGFWPKVPIIGLGGLSGFAVIAVFPAYFESITWRSEFVSGGLPEFHLVGLDSTVMTNQDISGKVAWLEFYTATCRPCIDEMASTEKVMEHIGRRDDVAYIGISSAVFENRDDFQRAVHFHRFPLWFGYESDSSLAATYAQSGVPVGLLIDKKGIVRYHKRGFGRDDAPYFEQNLAARIAALLAE
jgi:peroxiredoxin